jgi:beta propeller repeat protein
MNPRRIQGWLGAAILASSLWIASPAFADGIGDEVKIEPNKPEVSKAGFDLSRSYAVWINEGEKTITLYDLDKRKETKVGSNSSGKTSPQVDNKYVVWIDSRHGGADVYLYDIAKGTERRLTDGSAVPTELDVFGEYVVWTDQRDGKSDIYLYDVSKGLEQRVSTSGKASHPTVSGNYIAWEDKRNGSSDIYYYNMNKHQEAAATTARGIQTNPVIYADDIVYEDNRNGNRDIYLYSIDNGKEKRLTSDSDDQTSPALYRDTYIFVEDGDLKFADTDEDDSVYIEKSIYDQMPPRISGDNVLYVKRDKDKKLRLHLYNIDDEEMVPIGGFDGDPSQPDADSRYVTYVIDNDKEESVVLYDVETTQSLIVSEPGTEPTRPLVSNRFVVWYDDDDEALFAYDIRKGVRKQVTGKKDEPSDELYELSGSKLLWVNEGTDLLLTDLSDNSTEEIVSLRREPKSIDINGNYIVWVTDEGSNKGRVILYDLEEEDDTDIRRDKVEVEKASVGDGFVVWSEYTNGSWDLFYYDIEKGKTNRVLRYNERDQKNPQAAGSMILFEDNRNSMDKRTFYYELYDWEESSYSDYYWSDEAEMEEVRIGGNRVVWIDRRDTNHPTVYTMAFARPDDDEDEEDDDDNGGGNPGEYRDYSFVEVLEKGLLPEFLDDHTLDQVYFIFHPNTSQEFSISLEEALDDPDQLSTRLMQTDFDDIVVRVYE